MMTPDKFRSQGMLLAEAVRAQVADQVVATRRADTIPENLAFDLGSILYAELHAWLDEGLEW